MDAREEALPRAAAPSAAPYYEPAARSPRVPQQYRWVIEPTPDLADSNIDNRFFLRAADSHSYLCMREVRDDMGTHGECLLVEEPRGAEYLPLHCQWFTSHPSRREGRLLSHLYYIRSVADPKLYLKPEGMVRAEDADPVRVHLWSDPDEWRSAWILEPW